MARTSPQSFVAHLRLHGWLYAFMVPGLAFIVIFRYLPMYGVVIAFKDFNVVRGIWGSSWVGFANFGYLFTSSRFYTVFWNSLIISTMQLLVGFPVPIILSLLLNELRWIGYKRVLQTVIYLPHFISWVVVAGIVINFLSPAGGVLNYLIELVGGQRIPFLQRPEYFRWILVFSSIWKGAGWGTIVYLAAMAGIDVEIYTAAIVDGANKVQRMWYITLPGVSSTILVLLILQLGYILNNGFEQIFMLYSPIVYEVADVFETYTYRVGLLEGRFSFATAVGVFQSTVGMILIFTTNRLARIYGEAAIW